MELKKNKKAGGEEKPLESRASTFPDEVLERVLTFVRAHKDRSAVSLVCKDWYAAERWSRTHVFIGNCYSVSPEIVVRRFPNIRSVSLKGKPRFSDFSLVPPNWGADIHSWLMVFSSSYPFLEELRLKRMSVTDESLDFLARSFHGFKALSLVSCDGFSTNGLAFIASHCSYAPLESTELSKLLQCCHLLRRLWYFDMGCRLGPCSRTTEVEVPEELVLALLGTFETYFAKGDECQR
ncbi:Protein TRANSPORT INHIBITOR RESPONSE 1 [Platanthera guangdongensis]|uniref:Protein TRANSPORT INHIBITOR RESPONSE 1 n=1 Tax=Platanthera guangdongensis TaxID=2320717 RepID=A0ABR2MZW7_9ASPA